MWMSTKLLSAWTDTTFSALWICTFSSRFLYSSLLMLTLLRRECQWSPLKVICDVIGDGLWYLRVPQMTVSRQGDATTPACYTSCIHVQGNGENCYLPNTNIYQTSTPLERLQETRGLYSRYNHLKQINKKREQHGLLHILLSQTRI